MKKLAYSFLFGVFSLIGLFAYHQWVSHPHRPTPLPETGGTANTTIPPKQVTNTTPPNLPSAGSPGVITDIRGVIEGFYGQPWTYEQRIDMFHFMAQNHFNTYVYAPKDDPYQRANWAALYPTAQLDPMASLIQSGTSDGIQFVYSISPGIPTPLPGQSLTPEMVSNSISFTSTSDLLKLEKKLDQLRSVGVHTVMLSFDDVERSLKPVDQRVYGSDYARAHVDLANRLLKDERQRDTQFQLWFAPTTYYGLSDNHYWQIIRTRLNTSIPVIWTGKWVLNQSITSSQAIQVTKLIGRKPILWDNYPVNDYTYVVKKAPALLMGPLDHRSSDLPDHLSGYIANPMIQPESSKVPLATVGQYFSNPHSYQPLNAWQTAIQSAEGIQDPTAFHTFCMYSSQSTLNPGGYDSFQTMASVFWQTRATANHVSSENALRRELRTLQQLPHQLHSTVTNSALLAEFDPWLTKLGMEGQVGLLALDYLDMSPSDQGRISKRQALLSQFQSLQGNSLDIGNEIMAFIQKSLS
jgi:hyaluronoglucosaminidase